MTLTQINPLDSYSESETHVQGTVRELVSCGITANGVKLDKADLGVLLNLGMGELIGEVVRTAGSKGKAPKVYRIARKQDCVFSSTWLDFNFNLGAETN